MSAERRTLVILAAGMGSRYGGLKQLDPIGSGGATLMDYAVYDARRSGFTNVVVVIRPEMEDALSAFARAREGAGVSLDTVHQRLDDVPEGFRVNEARRKPWGTAHAVLAARRRVSTPFAVINADDFYGPAAYAAVSEFLDTAAVSGGRADLARWAVVAYRLRGTIPAEGGVNRAICRTTPEAWLTGVEEIHAITPSDGGFAGRGPSGSVALTGDEPVSMNMWAFTPDVFDVLRRDFAEFLSEADPLESEFLLPSAIQGVIGRGEARVQVLAAGSSWLGVTHSADRAAAAEALRALVVAGRYPERLW